MCYIMQNWKAIRRVGDLNLDRHFNHQRAKVSVNNVGISNHSACHQIGWCIRIASPNG